MHAMKYIAWSRIKVFTNLRVFSPTFSFQISAVYKEPETRVAPITSVKT